MLSFSLIGFDSRVTHDISLEESNSGFIPAEIQTRHSICGIIGIIQLVSGPALIVAKSGKKVIESDLMNVIVSISLLWLRLGTWQAAIMVYMNLQLRSCIHLLEVIITLLRKSIVSFPRYMTGSFYLQGSTGGKYNIYPNDKRRARHAQLLFFKLHRFKQQLPEKA